MKSFDEMVINELIQEFYQISFMPNREIRDSMMDDLFIKMRMTNHTLSQRNTILTDLKK